DVEHSVEASARVPEVLREAQRAARERAGRVRLPALEQADALAGLGEPMSGHGAAEARSDDHGLEMVLRPVVTRRSHSSGRRRRAYPAVSGHSTLPNALDHPTLALRPRLGRGGVWLNAVGATTVEAPGGRSLRTLFRKRRRTDRGVSFPELAWVHHLRQQELSAEHHGPYEGPAEQRYREFVERFEAANGEI